MSKESIIAFSQAKAEPLWLQDLRQAAFDKLDSLALPKIERVKFHRWNLGDGTIAENESSANVPDFTALGNNPKLVQVGTNTVLEQLPSDLINQGLVFTDLATALEEIPEVVESFFGKAVAYDEDKLAAYNYAYFNSAAVLYVPDNVEIDLPVESYFYQDGDSSVPFNKHVLIVAGKNSKLTYLERFETLGESTEKLVPTFLWKLLHKTVLKLSLRLLTVWVKTSQLILGVEVVSVVMPALTGLSGS